MKKALFVRPLCAAVFTFIAGTAAAQDLVPGINYSYNPPGSNGIITGITVDVCENDGVAVSQFDVSMYLYDQSSSNYWIIGTTTLNSLSGSSCVTISNWNIDINATPNIPAGTYRLGIWVDSGNAISENDENNNTGLLAGNINYTPSASGIISIAAPKQETKLGTAFPNPASGETKFSFTLAAAGKASLKLYDAVGREVAVLVDEEMNAGTYTYLLSAATLSQGVYFYTLHAGGQVFTQRLMITH